MAKGSGKRKGGAFEREVCKKLSLWISYYTNENVFWRSAMSGGRATVARKTRGLMFDRSAGDISAIDPCGHVFTDCWYVECKTYRDLSIDRFLILGHGGLLSRFWQQTRTLARKYGRKPMMVVKQHGMPALVIVTAADAARANFKDAILQSFGHCEVYLLDNLIKHEFDARAHRRLGHAVK